MHLATKRSAIYVKLFPNLNRNSTKVSKLAELRRCPVDQFNSNFFWNFQKCHILIDNQMLEEVFCSNSALSFSSGNHLFYKAEYMGRSWLNQVWAIIFDRSALATWAFLNCTWLSWCWLICAKSLERWASEASLKRAFKMQFRNA